MINQGIIMKKLILFISIFGLLGFNASNFASQPQARFNRANLFAWTGLVTGGLGTAYCGYKLAKAYKQKKEIENQKKEIEIHNINLKSTQTHIEQNPARYGAIKQAAAMIDNSELHDEQLTIIDQNINALAIPNLIERFRPLKPVNSCDQHKFASDQSQNAYHKDILRWAFELDKHARARNICLVVEKEGKPHQHIACRFANDIEMYEQLEPQAFKRTQKAINKNKKQLTTLDKQRKANQKTRRNYICCIAAGLGLCRYTLLYVSKSKNK
jgi:hypothetical protein